MKLFSVIGGSGFYDFLEDTTKKKVSTPFGNIQVEIGQLGDRTIIFLPRHGKGHKIPPHMINYRANIYGLKKLGVTRIIATNACGSLNPDIGVGDFIIPHDFIDWRKNRVSTFFDGKTTLEIDGKTVGGVVHISMTPSPYCPTLRKVLIDSAKELQTKHHQKGVYICVDGPRFESAAEINAFRLLGANIVGMTGLPELALARELAICYSTVCISTNIAAGIIPELKITSEEVIEIFGKRIDIVKDLLVKALEKIPEERNCLCKDALKGATS